MAPTRSGPARKSGLISTDRDGERFGAPHLLLAALVGACHCERRFVSTRIGPKQDDTTTFALQRENESADILAKNGYSIELGLFDPMGTPEPLLDEGVDSRLGTLIQVVEANPRPWNAVIEDLGFTPAARVEFRLDKFTDMSARRAQRPLTSGAPDRYAPALPTRDLRL